MKSNQTCNQLIGAPAVVTVVPTFSTVARQSSALWQLGVVLDGMRPATADVPTYAPKHAPRTFALLGPRTCDPPV